MWLCGGADNFPAPSILPAQHIFHGIIGLQFRVVELPAERDSCLRLGARAGIEGFHVAAERFCPRFSPVMPALGADMAVHMAVHESGFGKIPPGASEVDRVILAVAGQSAVREYQSVFLPGGSAGGSDECPVLALALSGMDLAVVKICGAGTKDKIDVPADIAVSEIIPDHRMCGRDR